MNIWDFPDTEVAFGPWPTYDGETVVVLSTANFRFLVDKVIELSDEVEKLKEGE